MAGSRRAITALAVVVAAVAAAIVGVPAARDAWTTWRTGVAPGSREVRAMTVVGSDVVVAGANVDATTGSGAIWRVSGSRWHELSGMGNDAFAAGAAPGVLVGASRGHPTVFEVDGGVVVPSVFAGRTGDLRRAATCGDTTLEVGSLTEDRLRGLAVARSANSSEWSPVDVGDVTMASAVACVGDDFVIAVARSISNSQTQPLMIEGRPASGWRELPLDAPGRAFVTAMTTGPSTTVAVGLADLAPAAWVRDGDQWTFAGHMTDGAPPGERVEAVAALPGGGFVAVGARILVGGASVPVAWLSDDGRSWQPAGVSRSNGSDLVDVTIAGDRVIAVGNTVERKRHRPQFYELRGTAFVAVDSVGSVGR